MVLYMLIFMLIFAAVVVVVVIDVEGGSSTAPTLPHLPLPPWLPTMGVLLGVAVLCCVAEAGAVDDAGAGDDDSDDADVDGEGTPSLPVTTASKLDRFRTLSRWTRWASRTRTDPAWPHRAAR